MGLISRHLKDFVSSATFIIEIKDFRKKLAETPVGDKIPSIEFFVNKSRFTIDLYIAGKKNSKDYISVYLKNHNDWMVRARRTISIKNEVFGKSPLGGFVYQSEQSLGRKNCVPHARSVSSKYSLCSPLSPNLTFI